MARVFSRSRSRAALRRSLTSWLARRRRLGAEALEKRALLAVTASVSDAALIEGDFGSANMEFTVRLSEPRAVGTIFNYLTTGQTATPGVDYDANFGSVAFPAGETEQVISIPIFGDPFDELDEQFLLDLSNPVAGALNLIDTANAGEGSSHPNEFIEFNGDIYFVAENAAVGRELWKYDGQNVSLAADIWAGSGSSSPGYLTVWNGALYFSAYTPDASGEIWRYDGATATRVTDFVKPQYVDSRQFELTVYKNELYFSSHYNSYGHSDLFKLRADHSVVQVANLFSQGSDDVASMLVYDDLLVFRARNSLDNWEMWTYNGATMRQYDLLPGASGSQPGVFTEMNGLVYFTATGYNGSGQYVGRELYQFDGNTVSLAADIRPGFDSSGPENLVAYHDALYFVARGRVDGDGNPLREFWKYDGETASLVMSEIPAFAGKGAYAVFNNDLYFGRNDPDLGVSLWRFDGVHLIPVLDRDTGNPYANYALRVIGDQLYFRAGDPALGAEMWTITPDVVFSDPRAVGTIHDDDGHLLSVDDISVVEGDSGTASAVFTVRLSTAAASPVTVDYATQSGTALVGEDFVDTRGTLTIPPGEQAVMITVPVLGDAQAEAAETFHLRLSNAQGADLLDDTATAAIVDDDWPVAQDDSYQGLEDQTLIVPATPSEPGGVGGVLVNDSDPNGQTLIARLIQGPSHGSLTLAADGSFIYTPTANFVGTDAFVYEADDGAGGVDQATVTLAIAAADDPPVAEDVIVSTPEDTAVSGALRGADEEGQPLTFHLLDGPGHGGVVLNGDAFTYTPAANYAGSDSFTYRVHDGQSYSAPATVHITVTPVNDAPVARSYQHGMDEDTVFTSAAQATDVDGDALTYTLVEGSGPRVGSLTFEPDGTFTYQPPANFHNTVSFQFQATDGALVSNVATIWISVRPVNDAPTAISFPAAVNEDTTLNLQLYYNDVDGDPVTFQIVTPPAHGALQALNSTGYYAYTPDLNYAGNDAIEFQVSDGQLLSNVGKVSLTIRPVNDPPAPADDAYSLSEDTVLAVAAPGVLANDADVDGDALTATLAVEPEHGSVTLAEDGSFTYTPAANYYGPDQFTYQAVDAQGVAVLATVRLTVGAVNDAPVAVDDSVTGNEDGNLVIDVLANDRDADGDALTPQLIDGPTHGTVRLNADGTFLYDPDTDYFGPDAFTYRVSDGAATSATATVSLSLQAQDETPVIDIAPFDAGTNLIDLKNAEVAVAILSSDSFNAVAQVNVASLTFGSSGDENSLVVHKKNGPKYEVRDVNGDGLLDLVAYFKTSSTGLTTSSTTATLRGQLLDGSVFSDSDAVEVVNTRTGGGGKPGKGNNR